MAKVVQVKDQQDPPSFDPNKQYKWEPTDIFEFTGRQLATIYHALTSEMHTPGGAPLIMKAEAYNVVMDIFRIGVKQGVIVESAAPSKQEANETIVKVFE